MLVSGTIILLVPEIERAHKSSTVGPKEPGHR